MLLRGNGPTAVGSKLGYLLSGPPTCTHSGATINSLHVVTQLSQHGNDDHQLDKFWSIEVTGIMPTQDQSIDANFLEFYSQTCISRLHNGLYSAAFPWKQFYLPTLITVKNEPAH